MKYVLFSEEQHGSTKRVIKLIIFALVPFMHYVIVHLLLLDEHSRIYPGNKV